jgi:hypothetical protein
MNAPGPVDVEAALVVAQQWLDTVDGVISVGEGDLDGVSTVDVWVAGAAHLAEDLPDRVHGVPVRIRDAGGPIEAQ